MHLNFNASAALRISLAPRARPSQPRQRRKFPRHRRVAGRVRMRHGIVSP